MWGLADLVYNVPYWLHEISTHVSQMVAILGLLGWLILVAYIGDAEKLGNDSGARRAATLRASRQLMTARDGKDFKVSIRAFKDYLCEEALEILPKVWHASRTTVRTLVFCRMFILAL